jgi:hypothetical protein
MLPESAPPQPLPARPARIATITREEVDRMATT